MHPASSRTCLAIITMAQAACTVTAIPPTEADRNREKVMVLEEEVRQLQRRAAELESALAMSRREAPPRVDGGAIPPEVLAAAPFAVALRIGRFSGIEDDESGGRVARLYLEPVDARGEIVQVAGSATVEVIAIDDADAATVAGRLALDPAAWRDRFRSGFLGAHYTVDVAISPTALAVAGRSSLLVRARVVDGFTGRTLEAEHLLPDPEVSSTR